MRKLKILFLLSAVSALSFNSFSQDLVVLTVNSPSTACGHTNSEVVSITVLNVGAATATAPYDISYTVNGGGTINQTITGAANNIAASGFKVFNFTTTANMATAGVYDFKSWVTLAADGNHANDTAYKSVNSDANTVPGNLLMSDTVCQSSNGDTLDLFGNTGGVVGWLSSTNAGGSWTLIGAAGTDSSYVYSNLTQTTWFTVVVRNGSCPFDSASPAVIQVDSGSQAGTITGVGNICAGSNGALTLTNFSGSIVDWESTQDSTASWTSLSNTTATQNYTNIQTTSDTLYRAIVKLGVCPADTSPVGILTIDPPSIGGIVNQIAGNDTVCSGSNNGRLKLNGYVGAINKWQVSVDGGGVFNDIAASAGKDSIDFNNITQTSLFRAQIQSGSCTAVFSASVTITVNAPTVGGVINSSTTVCKGSGGSLTLSGNVGQIQYWESSINGGGTWDTIFPINQTNSHTYSNLLSTTLFRAQVKNGYCPQIPSASATISVSDSTIGGTIATLDPTIVCAGNNSGTLTYSGGNGTVVDWEQSTDGGATFVSVPGPPVTSTSYAYSNITDTTLYRVQVQNSPCAPDFSDTLTIIVLPASVSGSIAGTSPVCAGDTVTLTLSGESGTISTWRVSIDGGLNYTPIGASAGQNIISAVVNDNSLFHAIVQNGTCDADTTADFAVNADSASLGGSLASNATECGGNNSATLTLSGKTGNVIDWIKSIDGGGNWLPVSGSPVTTNTFTYNNLSQTTLYKVRVKSGVCAEDSSSSATITVIPAAVGGTASLISADSLCASTATVTIQLSGHTGTIIGWEASENGGTSYTLVPGASGTPESFSYTFTTNTLFRALVRNGVSCDTVRSTEASVTVGSSSFGGTTAGIDTVCGGTNNGFVTLSGNNGDVVKWQSSTNSGVTWTDLPNSDSVAYNYVGLNNTTWFRAMVQDVSCPADFSDTVEIVIIPAAVGGTVSYAGTNVCSGASNFSLSLSGSSGTILRWEKSLNGVAWTSISNTTTTQIDSNITATTHYRAVLQTGACPEVPSIPDTVFVDQPSNAGTIAGNATHCDTGNVGMVLTTGYNGNIIAWQKQLNGGGYSTIGGSAGMDTINYTNLIAGTHDYKVIVSNGVCDNDTSAVATVQVDANVNPGALTGGTSYCTLTNSTLLTLSGYATSVQTWQRSVGGAPFTNIPSSANRDTFTFVNVTSPTAYRVIVNSGVCGIDTSNTQNIDVGQSIGGALSSSDSVCISGHTGLLQVSGFTGNIVTWQDSVSGGSWIDHVPNNAGIDTLRYTNLLQTVSYRVAVQSGTCDTSFSTIATITVNDTVFAGTLGSNAFFCDTTNSDTILLSGYFGPIKNWQVAINGGPFTDFSPAKTDSAYIFNNLLDSISEFRVIMDGGVCGSDTSNTVEVKVAASLGGLLSFNDTILITGDTVCSGNNMGVIYLNNYAGNIISWDSATVPGMFAPMNYTLDSLVYVNVEDTVTYKVRVQNPGCPVDTSNEVTIITVPGTSVGNLTGSRSHCTTTNSDSVILVGRNGSIALWQFSSNMGATWDTVPSQLTDTFVYSNLTTTTMYRVIVQAAGICPNDTSNIVTIQIGPSDAGSISGDTLLCAGSTANLLLSGYTGDVLAWENSIDGVMWNPIPASNTNVISEALSITTFYRAIVQSDTCTSDTSAIHTVTIDQPFTGVLTTPTTQLCYGVGSDTIFISQVVNTVFDWEFRADTSASYTSLANTGQFQTFSNLTITTHYRTFVKNGVCPVDTADITLTVDTFTIAGSIMSDDTVCANDNNGVLMVSGHLASNFNWQESVDGGANWGTAPGATNDTFYVYNNLANTTLYRLVLSSGGCPSDTTNQLQIFVKPAAVGGTLLADTSYCKVPNNGVLKLTGYNGNIKGWQQSIGGSGYVDITPPVVVDSLIYNNIDTTTSYRVILSLGDCPDDTSSVATITILNTPVTSVTADGPTEFCEGGSVTLSASGNGSLVWSSGESVSDITVNTGSNYIVVLTDTSTGCTDSDSLLVSVYPVPAVNAGNDVIIISGQSTALLATGASTYEWTPKSSLSDGFVPNPIASPTDSTLYFVIGLDTNGCEATDSVLVGVIPGEPEGPPTFTNLFTPNGDGHNDKWNITDLAECNTCKVAIYNRYGQQVYESNNYQNDWEGTNGGSKLPDGTYYYVVETETGKIFKGAITILRGE